MGDDLCKVGLIGGGFQHAYSTTLWRNPKYFKWAKGEERDHTFWIDDAIRFGISSQCPNKYAWVVESRDICPGLVEFIKQNAELISNSYKYLFTHNKEIYDLADNFIFIPSHCSWIEKPQIYNKTKLCSMISSNKGWTDGHRRRLAWVEKFRNDLDLYGFGFSPIDKKEDGLKDYCFSICVENDSYPTYFSEKILDCFACGTVPVYYGAPDIAEHFNPNGIILLNDKFSLDSLSLRVYHSMRGAILENFELATKYNTIEDLLWRKWISR